MNTAFMPLQHGFSFPNRFEFNFAASSTMAQANRVNMGDIIYGLCGGMCFATLDYYYAGLPVPKFTNPDELPMRYLLYLWNRQLDSLGLLTLPKVISWMLRSDDDVALRVARYEIPRLRRSLDGGAPAVLALIRAKGLNNPTNNHQVLAVGYEENNVTRDFRIKLYDPNHPGKAPELSLNLSRPSDGIQIKQTTGEALRGFFIIPYRRETPPVL